VQARVVCPAANIAVTVDAEERLHRRGVLCLPDFVVNAGGALASWVDFLEGTPEQAFEVIGRKLGTITRELLAEHGPEKRTPSEAARAMVRERIFASDGRRLSWEETRETIRGLLGL
jgi:glutamate dehydrogenase/leucine dehydrogenase